MNKLLEITAENINEFGPLAPDLAGVYQVAFAGPPWNERSRCPQDDCEAGFSGCETGKLCKICGSKLVNAYDKEELVNEWRNMIMGDQALFMITLLEGQPTCATLARPTTPAELFRRKYQDVPAMRGWLEGNMPPKFIWIEDTFADRGKRPRGNLKNRGEIINLINETYGNNVIATRTLAIEVIAATIRDKADFTSLFIGAGGIGTEFARQANLSGQVPDRRTFIRVERGAL